MHAADDGSAARRRRWAVSAAAAAVVLAVAIAGGLEVSRLASGSPSSAAAATTTARHGLDGEASWAPGVRPAPAITTLHDQTGRRFSLGSLRGRTVAIEFFDSHCHAQCPLAGRTLAAAERLVPAAQRPALVVVSVNPRDTPASTRVAVRHWGLAGLAPWYWLRGSRAQLAAVWRAYHIYVKPAKGDITHTEALYLLGRSGDERSGYLYPYLPASVAHDMRTLAGRAAGDV